MAFIATVVNATIYLALSWTDLPHWLLLSWYSVFALITLLRIGEARWWAGLDERQVEFTQEQIDKWKLRFDFLIFLSGNLWGFVGWTFSPNATAAHQVLSVLLLAGISSGAVISYSPSPRTVICSIVPMLLPLELQLVATGDATYMGMAVMVFLYVVLIVTLAQNLARNNDQSISYALDRAELLAESNSHKAASNAKSMFLARISHEIRTPLTSIIGFADRALRSPAGINRADVEVILRNGSHLLALVNDLLDLARIESGHVLIEKRWIPPAQEIRSAILMIQPAAKKKNLEIVTVGGALLHESVYTDPNRFRQILINLLNNAINFTDAGRITIEPKHAGFMLEVFVRDSGVGISAEMAKKIFVPFVRGEHGVRVREAGMGLGLALAGELAEALGGKLALVSSQVGQGSTFMFSVDTRPPAGVSPFPVSEPATAAGPDSENPLGGRRILVADDDSDLRDLIRWNLERAGASVEVAVNGRQAICLAEQKKFDAILMDIQMPEMNGHEAMGHLRTSGHREPIIAITAHASFEEKLNCLETGYTAYVSKPFEPRSLIHTIRKHLNERSA